jgi:cysteine synthase
MSAEARAIAKKKARLVEVAPDDAPETRHKLSPAKGMLIGAGVCAVFWAAVAAAVVAGR